MALSNVKIKYLAVTVFILLFIVPFLSAQAADPVILNYPIKVAVFPLVYHGKDASVNAEAAATAGLTQKLLDKVVHDSVSVSESGDFTLVPIDHPPADAAAAPLSEMLDGPLSQPDAATMRGVSYAITSQIFLDGEDTRVHGQIWLWNIRTGTLVVTDEMVYEDIDALTETAPILTDYILSRIPTYFINLAIEGGGGVTYNGDELEPGIYGIRGDAAPVFEAAEGPGSHFESWTITPVNSADGSPPTPEGEMVRDVETPQVSLELSDKTYPGDASLYDPTGKKINMKLDARFIHDPFSRNGWYLEAGYRPLVRLSAAHDDLFDQAAFPVGFSLQGGFYPLQRKWGHLGLGLEAGYSSLKGPRETSVLSARYPSLFLFGAYRSSKAKPRLNISLKIFLYSDSLIP
jgi:hypothetical protein